MTKPLFRKVDCVLLRATSLDAAVEFYCNKLGHTLLWRSEVAVGFAMPETDAELVVHTQTGPETDLLVDDVSAAHSKLMACGATTIVAPFEISIGRCAVVKDPLGNVLTILDQTKGRLQIDADKKVIGTTLRTMEGRA